MSYGMSYEQYWYGDPWIAKAFLEKQMLMTERMNQEAWLHGSYVNQAVTVALANAFRDKGARVEKYPPVQRITPLSEREKEQEKIEALRKLDAFFDSMETRFDSKKKREQSEEADNVHD